MTQNSWFVLIWIFNRRYQMMYILEFYQCLQINFFVKKGDVLVGSKVQKGEMKTCQWLLFSLLNVFSLQIPSTFNSQFQGKQVFCFPLLLLSKGKKKTCDLFTLGVDHKFLCLIDHEKGWIPVLNLLKTKTLINKFSQSRERLSFENKPIRKGSQFLKEKVIQSEAR